MEIVIGLAPGLAKLRPDDDPEAFLQTFEQVAKAAGWEESTWDHPHSSIPDGHVAGGLPSGK